MSKLDTALSQLGKEAREAFLAHLRAGTSAEWLADWLKRAGHSVGTTTIKTERKRLRDVSQ